MQVGKWQAFAEAELNHEPGGRNRPVTAALTPNDAPSYATTATPVASDWATLSAGASYRLSSQVMLRVATFSDVFSPQVIGYGGERAVSVGV